MATTFINAVNDVLVQDGILAGDDDAITDFSSLQHVASIRWAKLAVQNELADFLAITQSGYEYATAVLTTSASTRTVDLPTGFLRFIDERPWFIESDVSGVSDGAFIYEYRGGEKQLRKNDLKYKENSNKPINWYWAGGANKSIGFYPVPDATYYYRIEYEKELTVTDESDTLPFLTVTEARVFIQLCTRHFKYLRSSPQIRQAVFPAGIDSDPDRLTLQSKLISAGSPKPPARHYGRNFISARYPGRRSK